MSVLAAALPSMESLSRSMSRIGIEDHYVTVVLPALILLGGGLGLSLITAINLGVAGVEADDAGVALASNAMQQIGGSPGPALLSTIAASAVTGYLVDRAARLLAPTGRDISVLNDASVHSSTVVFSLLRLSSSVEHSPAW